MNKVICIDSQNGRQITFPRRQHQVLYRMKKSSA